MGEGHSSIDTKQTRDARRKQAILEYEQYLRETGQRVPKRDSSYYHYMNT